MPESYINPVRIPLVLPNFAADEEVRLPVPPGNDESQDWRDLSLRLAQVAAGIFFARELLLGSALGTIGAGVITGVTLLAGVWLDESRALRVWQRYSNECEKQINQFSRNNARLKRRHEELKIEISTLKSQVATLVDLQRTVGGHISKLESVEKALISGHRKMVAMHGSMASLSKKYKELHRKNLELYSKNKSLHCKNVEGVQALGGSVVELREIAGLMRQHFGSASGH